MGEYGIGILHQHLVYGVHEDGRSRVVNWVGQVRRIFISLQVREALAHFGAHVVYHIF